MATLTISDTRTADNDASGQRLVALLAAAGVRLVPHQILPDEPTELDRFLLALPSRADAAVLTGGTGISQRDQTYEALVRRFDKQLDGFGEAFRALSFQQIGPRAMLSRAVAGVIAGVVVFALPGSTGAVELGVSQLVVPVLAHAVDLARGRIVHS